MPTVPMALTLEEAQAKSLVKNQRVEAAVLAVELAQVGVIFGLKQFLTEFLAGLGHLILFPLLAASSVIRAILDIREYYLEKKDNKKSAGLKAVIETLAAAAISTAVIGGLVAETSFSLAAPIIFTATLALKTVYHFIAAAYYFFKSRSTGDAEAKKNHRAQAGNHFRLGLINVLSTLAAGLVFVGNKLSFGMLGVIAAVFGTGYALYRAFTLKAAKSIKGDVSLASQASTEPSRARKLNSAPASSPQISLAQKSLQQAQAQPIQTKDETVPTPSQSGGEEITFLPPPGGLAMAVSPLSTTSQAVRQLGLNQINFRMAMAAARQREQQLREEEMQQQRKALQSKAAGLNKELGQRKIELVENLNKLERYLGSGAAFHPHNYWNSQYKGFEELYLTHWTTFKGNYKTHYNTQARYELHPQAIDQLVAETQTIIDSYNQCLKANKAVLVEAGKIEAMEAREKASITEEKQKEADRQMFWKTGWTEKQAMNFGHLLGLGAEAYTPG